MNGIWMNIKNNIMVVLKWCSLILCLVSMAIFLTLNFSIIFVFFSHQEISGVTHSEILRDYGHLLLFLQVPGMHTINFQFIPISVSGKIHFSDVKQLILLNELILIITGCLTYYEISRQKKKHQLWRLMLPIKGLVVFIPTMMLILLINFNSWFIKFHELVFSNQDWIFNPTTDPIINVLTENFFGLCVIAFTILIELMLGVLYYAGNRQLY